jgi:capsular exopolysaccharide synthesis family protein
LTDLRIELAEAKSELTEKHPKVRTLKKQVQIAEAELEQEIGIYKVLAPQLEELDRQIASLEAHLRGVDADIEKYSKMIGFISDKGFKQANLDLNLDVTQTVLGTLLDYQYQVGIAEATTLSEIRVVDPAVKPTYPVSPNKLLNTLLGVFLGLMCGVGLAFLREYLDDAIRTEVDVREFKPIALIGSIPQFERKSTPLISSMDTNDPLYESYRHIRTSLKFISDKRLRSLLVGCANPGEGKTTTVVNLGISLSHEGKRVAIVDMDLRRPSIHNVLDLPNEVGVVDVLEGKAEIDEAIQPTDTPGLSVITSGPMSSDPGKLIESAQMEPFILALEDRFDTVILDSAPLLVKTDFLILASYVDGTIVLLESGRTTRQNIDEIMETLEKGNIKPLGFVLNKLSPDKGRYYYYNKFYHGRHYDSETEHGIPKRTRPIWSRVTGRTRDSETRETFKKKGGRRS